VTKVLQTQASSIEALRLQNAELNKIRNTLDINTQADLIQQLNEKIESNTAIIKENADAVTQQKMNIGNYSDSIRQALSGLEAFGIKIPPAFGKVINTTKSMGTSATSLTSAIGGTVKSLGALT